MKRLGQILLHSFYEIENQSKNFSPQDLENNIRNHSDDRLDKIQEIASELVEHKIMVDSISSEVQNITERWNLLQHQVCDIRLY